uniref:hypothetical protein n=1 Tax=Enterobacter cloacae TaxID=550 RepID=UPI0037043029
MAAHMTAHQIGNWSPGIKTLITLVKSFGTDHVELWTHEYHHEAKEYPDGEYDHFFPAYVDQYNRKLHGDSKQLINDLYLTVIYKQVGIKHRSSGEI